jgi:hypothetical protein
MERPTGDAKPPLARTVAVNETEAPLWTCRLDEDELKLNPARGDGTAEASLELGLEPPTPAAFTM